MRGFITEVADALYRRYGDDISSLRLVFPNRRAQLFFCDALSSLDSQAAVAARFR